MRAGLPDSEFRGATLMGMNAGRRTNTRGATRTQGATQNRRKQKTPWVRRIISTSVLALILIALVYGAVALVRGASGFLAERHEQVSEGTIATPVEISVCDPADMSFDVSVAPSIAAVGEAVNVTVEATNTGAEGCSLDTSDVSVQLKMGKETVWNPTECDSGWGKTLLLAPDQPWSTTVTWNGRTQVDCETVVVSPNLDNGDEWFESYEAAPGAGSLTLTVKMPGGKEATATVNVQ